MPRYSAGVLTGAGSTELPLISLYASASVGAKIREIGVSNTSTTAVAIKLVRLTTTDAQGSGLTEAKHDPDSAAAACTTFGTHSGSPPPTATELGYRAVLGAAAGAGVIFTFGDAGIRVDPGVTNGIGVVVENGTGQACQAYIVWDE